MMARTAQELGSRRLRARSPKGPAAMMFSETMIMTNSIVKVHLFSSFFF